MTFYYTYAQVLLEAGADIEARDTWNKTALLLAAEMGGLKMTQLLLEQDSEVNARNKNNQTGEFFLMCVFFNQTRGSTEVKKGYRKDIAKWMCVPRDWVCVRI